jgi:hypothetical protein
VLGEQASPRSGILLFCTCCACNSGDCQAALIRRPGIQLQAGASGAWDDVLYLACGTDSRRGYTMYCTSLGFG